MEKFILISLVWLTATFTMDAHAETPCAMCQVILSQKDDISCHGRKDGLLRVTSFNCKGKISYVWSNGGKTSEIKNLGPGKYTIVLTDEDGAMASATYEIIEPLKLTVDGSKFDPLCYGDATGTIYPNVNGGTPMYSFKWSNGQTVQYINSLKAGTYSLTVTDDNGCTAVNSWTIVDPPKVSVGTDYKYDVSCAGGNDGEIGVYGKGGTGKHTYSWSTGSSSPGLKNLKAGVYSVTVFDEYLCEGTATYTISEPAKLTVKLDNQRNITCHGKKDGILSVDGSGGTAPYTFSWSNGSTNAKITNLLPGSYTVTITDKNGCKATETYTIKEPSKLNVSLKNIIHNKCFGTKKGEIEVSVTGGTSPYSYSWSNGGSSRTITGLAAGKYDLTVTDKNLCEIKVTYTITEPTELTLTLVEVVDVTCFDQKNGSIEVVGKGGTPPYSYSWSTGGTGAKIQGLAAGNYDVTIRDDNDCEITQTYKVVQPDQLMITLLNKKDNSCFDQEEGELEVEGQGGKSPYSYEWSTGSTSSKISMLKAGNYEVTVTDENKCTATASYTIQEPSKVQIELLLIESVLCAGGNTGSIGVAGRGGVAPYTYEWSNGHSTGLNNSLTAGTYDVVVKDKNGCSEKASYTITEPDSLKLTTVALTHNSCGATGQGAIEIELNGGASPYTYLWSNGATTARIEDLATGIYSVEGKDDNGCFVRAEFEILETQNLLPTREIVRPISCYGENDGFIGLVMDGGTGPYTYDWSNGATTSSISDLGPGGYAVTVRDANDCTFDKTYLITEPDPLVIVDQFIQDVGCHNEETGSIGIKVQGGTGSKYIKWTYRPTDSIRFEPIFDGLLIKYDTIDSLASGSYAIELRDENDCTLMDTFEILNPTPIELEHISTQDVRCSGQKSGSVGVQLKGGTEIYFIKWTYRPEPGAMTNPYAQRDLVKGDTLYNLVGGTYYLQATDTNGCVFVDSFELKEPKELEIQELIKTDLLCHGDSSGEVSISIQGGSSPYSMEWTYNDGSGPRVIKNSNNVLKDSVDLLSGGKVILYILDENKCVLTDSVEVVEPDPIVRDYAILTSPECHGDSTGRIILEYKGGTQINLIEWTYRADPMAMFEPYQTTHNQVLDSIVSSPSGEYQIRVSDQNNCYNESIINLRQPDPVDYTIEHISPSTGNNGEIEIDVFGGWGFFEYEWSGPGGFTSDEEDIMDLVPGDYVCAIVDAVQCPKMTEIITVPLSTWTENPVTTLTKMYPIPAYDVLYLDFNSADSERVSYLVDAQGRYIRDINLSGVENKVDVSDLESGNYYVLFLEAGKKYGKKFSKF